MLELISFRAVVMAVAKNTLSIPNADAITTLKAGFAALAGAIDLNHIRTGDVLRVTCELVDELIDRGLLRRPMASVMDSFKLWSHRSEDQQLDNATALLYALLGAMAVMQVRKGDEVLVEWERALKDENIAQKAFRLVPLPVAA